MTGTTGAGFNATDFTDPLSGLIAFATAVIEEDLDNVLGTAWAADFVTAFDVALDAGFAARLEMEGLDGALPIVFFAIFRATDFVDFLGFADGLAADFTAGRAETFAGLLFLFFAEGFLLFAFATKYPSFLS